MKWSVQTDLVRSKLLALARIPPSALGLFFGVVTARSFLRFASAVAIGLWGDLLRRAAGEIYSWRAADLLCSSHSSISKGSPQMISGGFPFAPEMTVTRAFSGPGRARQRLKAAVVHRQKIAKDRLPG